MYKDNVWARSYFILHPYMQGHYVIAMGIDITQWRVEIAKYWKFAGRKRHSRRKLQGVKTVSVATCNPMLTLLLTFCLITAPSLLLQAGDVERNPGPPKEQGTFTDMHTKIQVDYYVYTSYS